MTFSPGDEIIFTPGEVTENKPGQRRGVFDHYVETDSDKEQIVNVQLSGDPFNVCVYEKQIRPLTDKEKNMPTATTAKPKAKDLRRQAKALGVEGWEDMSLDELIDAVAKAEKKDAKGKSKSKAKKAAPAPVEDEDDDEDDDEEDDDEDDDEEDDDEDEEEDEAPAKSKKSSKKASAKKAPAKAAAKSKGKTAAKASTKDKGKAKGKATKKAAAKAERPEAENGNPYAEGTNLWYMAEALIKGGKVSTLVKNLRKKVEINPRSREYDDDSLNAELQRRLIIVSQHLRNDFGFEMEKEGRGWDATIRCFKE